MRGHIEKRGKTWSAVIDMPRDPVTGKRHQKRITAPTKRETEAKMVEFIASVEQDGFTDSGRLTVGEYLEQWLESKASRVKPSTDRRYADTVRLHLTPNIGAVRLNKLTAADVERLYAKLLKKGLSPTTVSTLHAMLHNALKQAVRRGLLSRNVTEAVDPPRRATPEAKTWNQQEVISVLAAAEGDELEALWRLALLTGMRRGEILGLWWADVDLERGTLAVRRTLIRGDGGRWAFGTPKTAKGRRQIALPSSVVESLRHHRVRQVKHRLALGEAYHDNDMVFANGTGEPLHPNTLTWRFKRLMARAGVPAIRFHDLRHTSASLMLQNGEHPKVVQERLGHANISITLDLHSHLTSDMQRDAAQRLDTLIGKAS